MFVGAAGNGLPCQNEIGAAIAAANRELHCGALRVFSRSRGGNDDGRVIDWRGGFADNPVTGRRRRLRYVLSKSLSASQRKRRREQEKYSLLHCDTCFACT